MVTRLKMNQQCTLVARRPAESWAVRKYIARKWSSLSGTGNTTSGVLCPVVGFAVQYRCGHTEPKYCRKPQRWIRDWSICHRRRGWESWIILGTWRRMLSWEILSVYININYGKMRRRGRCFAWWPEKEQKAIYVRGTLLYLSLSLQQNCFLMTKWNRLLIEAVESLFLNILKTWQDTVLENVLYSTLLWEWSYSRWSPEGAFSFNNSVILWLCWIIKSVPVPSWIPMLLCLRVAFEFSSWWILNIELAWMFSAVCLSAG